MLAVEGDSLRIATAQGDILLGGCFDPQGGALADRIAPGTVLPRLDAAQAQTLAARTPGSPRANLPGHAPLRVRSRLRFHTRKVFPQRRRARRSSSIAWPLETPNRGAATVAAFLAWLSALGGQERVSVMYCDAMLAEQAKGLENWLSPWVPLTLATRAQSGTLEAAALAEGEIARSRQAGPCPRDLRFRLGDKHPDFAALAKIGVRLGGDAPPEGVELLLAADPSGRSLELVASSDVFPRETVALMAGHLAWWLKAFESTPGCVADIPLLPPGEAQALAALNATETPFDSKTCVHEAITAQVAHSVGHVAISQQSRSISYGELEERATALAVRLRASGVVPGDIVGLCLERTPDLVIALLAILKTGAAYLPLDPDYPRDRIAFMVADSGTRLVVTREALAASLGLAAGNTFLLDAPPSFGSAGTTALHAVTPDSAAYVIYTSGSTGRPKGVMVEHRNVVNFFAGMDAARAGTSPRDVARGHEPVVRHLGARAALDARARLHRRAARERGARARAAAAAARRARIDFSLFYFASDGRARAGATIPAAARRRAVRRRHGFAAVWTPERHFHAFGGLYPNPAVTSAAVAAITERVADPRRQLRAARCTTRSASPRSGRSSTTSRSGRVGHLLRVGLAAQRLRARAPRSSPTARTSCSEHRGRAPAVARRDACPAQRPAGKTVEVRDLPAARPDRACRSG